MKTRETKQKDLVALTESLQNSTSAMVVSFSKLSVTKDQEFRNRLREAGAEYQVVKNTLARIAVKGTPFEGATEHFKGVTAIAWTQSDPVVLSKAMAKFMKDNADTFTFKAGVLDGQVLDLKQVTDIAGLPSKEELIAKMLYVLNAQAQRIVTVINAVPRDLAVVIKQIGEQEGRAAGEAAEATPPVEAAPDEEGAAPAAEADAAPAAEAAEAQDAAPAAEATPAEEAAPAAEATLAEDAAPAAEAAPVEEAAPAAESAPSEEAAHGADDAAPLEEAGPTADAKEEPAE